MKISSLYRQQQLAIVLIDMAQEEDMIASLDWYTQNMNLALHMITTDERAEKLDLVENYPDVTFILFSSRRTTGEYINAVADVCQTTFFLTMRTDSIMIEYDGQELMDIMQDRNHPAVITPVMVSGSGDVIPTLRAPHLRGKEFDPLSFVPTVGEPTLEDNLYPLMGLGLYDRALFQRLRAFDDLIGGEYYQMADYGVRCHLFGYGIKTTRHFSIQFPQRMSIIEDRSDCEGMNRFYTKALSIHRIAGKNVVQKWKPFVDKALLNDEVKKKQIIIQKTDFFTLMDNWKTVGEN